jgi:hypothetical protein
VDVRMVHHWHNWRVSYGQSTCALCLDYPLMTRL